MNIKRKLIAALISATPMTASASDIFIQFQNPTARTGVTGIWILANISYAGMRAQNSASAGWRITSFIFGFPGTLISYFAIEEGSERAYGIDLPRRTPPKDEDQ
jgi:hypothetical protein